MAENHQNEIAPVPKLLGQYSIKEKLLLPISLLIAILFDRLMVFSLYSASSPWNFFGAFWLCCIVIFYAFYWSRLKKDKVAWFVAICTAALSIWFFTSPERQNWQYSFITFLVIPNVLMAHTQWVAGGYTLKNSDGIAAAWFMGWFVKPFSGLFALFGTIGSLLSAGNKSTAKRVLAGVGIAALLLLIVIPLLMGADQVFNYYLRQLFSFNNPLLTFFHIIVVITSFGLIYSFLWNVGFGKVEQYSIKSTKTIDDIISAIVLGSVILVYALFCIIQFTYLFAGVGLPAGMTYSEYAREGFAQTVIVCAINLLIFGIFLRFGKQHRLSMAMLCGLLVTTGIMLFSGAVRLNLYVGAYGMTWLRLLSAWFIIYLAVVIILCVIRLLLKRQLPIIALCALFLLAWYVALGYLNPDGFIDWYNYDFFVR